MRADASSGLMVMTPSAQSIVTSRALDAELIDGDAGDLLRRGKGDASRFLAHRSAFGVETREHGGGRIRERLQRRRRLAFGLRYRVVLAALIRSRALSRDFF